VAGRDARDWILFNGVIFDLQHAEAAQGSAMALRRPQTAFRDVPNGVSPFPPPVPGRMTPCSKHVDGDKWRFGEGEYGGTMAGGGTVVTFGAGGGCGEGKDGISSVSDSPMTALLPLSPVSKLQRRAVAATPIAIADPTGGGSKRPQSAHPEMLKRQLSTSPATTSLPAPAPKPAATSPTGPTRRPGTAFGALSGMHEDSVATFSSKLLPANFSSSMLPGGSASGSSSGNSTSRDGAGAGIVLCLLLLLCSRYRS